MEMAIAFLVWSFLFLFLCLEATLGQDIYESDFRHCYRNFFQSTILKVAISQLYQSSFSAIARHVNNSILKDTLRLKILWTWIKICANSFIKTLVNNMKQKSAKIHWTLSLEKRNATLLFKEHCTKIDISLVFIPFFFSQTKLVFKSNSLFIDI